MHLSIVLCADILVTAHLEDSLAVQKKKIDRERRVRLEKEYAERERELRRPSYSGVDHGGCGWLWMMEAALVIKVNDIDDGTVMVYGSDGRRG
ncbi:hypothetical protein HanXRQr2_Chr15g0680551 [Helianthus annuus]|uniref:Uncharacterized protein n=1 Tax=Helianthus annuus TaxID=4232 RepID=A0A251S719_HELAN|nr:hypothetical protein HanXRQr2_Chr15g0680551 [Helianthus annuus]KAJ0830211.1 hypothetical protein HanPSC8_Chr15g0652621 [Helianthus annuus]